MRRIKTQIVLVVLGLRVFTLPGRADTHIYAGALGTNQNDKLFFSNGTSFDASLSSYALPQILRTNGLNTGYYRGDALTFSALPATPANGVHIQHLCSNMQSLIGNLLDIGKIEGGVMEFTREPVNVSEFMKEHLDDFKEHAATKHISLILEDRTPNSCIVTDRSALQRISENLISNALKFSPPHTRVIIRLEQNDHHLKMEVQDHGLGIQPDEINLLFRKFQKLSTRPTGGEGSSGLGLSIVKELVTALNGKISVSSEVNKGTTFSVELPVLKGT